MATENPIRKRRIGWGYAVGRARARYGWVGICPDCAWTTPGAHTRKQAKDGLYRHRKQHEPGSVGRV